MNKRILFIQIGLLIAAQAFAQYDDQMKVIGQSSLVSYVMYTDNNGNLYYINIEDHFLDLLKYDIAQDTVIKIADNFVDDRLNSSGNARNTGFGAIAPTVAGDTVYCMTTAGSGSGYADVYRLICSQNKLEHLTQIIGQAYWMIWNLTLSKDGKTLYYISNNASVENKALYKIDIASKKCEKVLALGSILPNRDLCFGGINVWDHLGSFYLPVWSFSHDDDDLAVLKITVNEDNYTARLLHFTEDGSEAGARLFPGFRHHSCWSGIGASSKGNIYIAASNHYQSTDGYGEYGNVAIYKYDPVLEQIKLLGDLKSVSESVYNWMEGESQHKVHTFLVENEDGKLYFASDDYYPSYFIRGAHIYTIDIETDAINDYSKTQPYVMTRDFDVIENAETTSTTSGVFAEYYGIKGISLNANAPEYLYGITFSNPNGISDPGYIIKHKIFNPASKIEAKTTKKMANISAYPNPFNNRLMFQFKGQLANDELTLKIYDVLGRLVGRRQLKKTSFFRWEGKKNAGMDLPSGLYIYTIESKKQLFKGKIIKIK
jgi:hypothetical protein